MRASKKNILDYLREIKNELKSDGIVTLALFGSFAREENGVYSDIDIAIAKENDYLKNYSAYNYFDEVNKIKNMIQKKFHRNSDIFDLDSDSVMKKSIMKDLVYV